MNPTLPRPDAGRTAALETVQHEIVSCSRCSRLRTHCHAVATARKREYRDQAYWGRPVPGFGDPGARLLIVGLAPAAHGGNRTGRVFTGDSSGDWLYEALHRYGWASRPTAARATTGWCSRAATSPPRPGARRPATGRPARSWSAAGRGSSGSWRLLRGVRVVLVLGRIGWERWLRASGGGPASAGRAAQRSATAWRPPCRAVLVLLSSFHPSRQNTNTGRLTRGMWYAVFARAREVADAPG